MATTNATNTRREREKRPQGRTKIRKKQSFWNIGTIMFAILFLYMAIYFIMLLMSRRVTPYEVTAGSLSGNYRYTAVALKSEQIVYSNESGEIHYYAKEKSKVGVGAGIYSVGNLKLTSNSSQETTELDEADYDYLRTIASNFSNNYSSTSFQDVYNFKADSQTAMLEILSKQVNIDAEEGSSAGLNLVTTAKEGYILYSMDGMEELTIDDITGREFVRTDYKRESFRMRTTISAKDPVYKLVTSEDWFLVILLDRKTATELSDLNTNTVRFTFLKDGSVFNAGFQVVERNGEYLGILNISNSVARFLADRYIQIELLINKESGLKIPNSSIVEKGFYKIPKEYVTMDENTGKICIIRETYDSDGSAITRSVYATVYDESETDYYVDMSLFSEGDYVLMKDSRQRYQVSDTKKLIGVYNINKGYAVFREITIIDRNEEYSIVAKGSEHGLSQYDHIALDASAVKDDSIIV